MYALKKKAPLTALRYSLPPIQTIKAFDPPAFQFSHLVTEPFTYNAVILTVNKKVTYQMKAIWNNQIIAESDDIVVIEGNHYFPESSLKKEFIEPSTHSSVCPWKGTASYYSLNVNGQKNKDAVWYYSHPSELAKGIKDRVAFWKGVEISK